MNLINKYTKKIAEASADKIDVKAIMKQCNCTKEEAKNKLIDIKKILR